MEKEMPFRWNFNIFVMITLTSEDEDVDLVVGETVGFLVGSNDGTEPGGGEYKGLTQVSEPASSNTHESYLTSDTSAKTILSLFHCARGQRCKQQV